MTVFADDEIKPARQKRPYGTGELLEKHGAWYGRWRSPDGRRRCRRLAPVKSSRCPEGLTRTAAEGVLARVREEVDSAIRGSNGRTVSAAAAATRESLSINGASLSHVRGCASMERVHFGPVIGDLPVTEVRRADIERVIAAMRDAGRSVATIRSTLGHLRAVFDTAIDRG